MKKENSESLVLDSWSLLAYFKKEEGGFKVKKLLKRAEKGGVDLYLCLINWGEVYYQILRSFGRERLRRATAVIEQSPIKLVEVDKELVTLAAEQKVVGGFSFADCFVIATAQRFSAKIVTGDPDFKKVEKLVDIVWIG